MKNDNAELYLLEKVFKRIEQLEEANKVFSSIVSKLSESLLKTDKECLRHIEHTQFLAKRLEAQASRIAVLEGHPRNFEKTIGE